MKFGYVKIGAYTPKVQVADVEHNANNVIEAIEMAKRREVELLVFPELVLTGATCGDLFYNETLLSGAKQCLKKVVEVTKNYVGAVIVGLPMQINGNIYNVAAVLNRGKVIGLVPKTLVSLREDVNRGRFSSAPNVISDIKLFGYDVTFGSNLIFKEEENSDFSFAVEFGSELHSSFSPSTILANRGANVIACLGASPMTVGKTQFDLQTIKAHSLKINSAYVYAEAGEGETTSDMVFGGHNVISECGKILSNSNPFSVGLTINDVDTQYIKYQRSKSGEMLSNFSCEYKEILFSGYTQSENIDREYEKYPFLPDKLEEMPSRAQLILDIQAEALKKRISHTRSSTVVLGLSGGLDSTLAIIVAVNAMKALSRSPKDVVAVTMPCFGTTGRTFNNSVKLAKALGTTLKKIDIAKSVTRHLKDIKHNGQPDVTFENAQARERTQVLMDVANMTNGLVIGTGDLSELALGWSTYNGDHMSMYAVNGALPKTLIRHIVECYANKSKTKLKSVLLDILDTPVSPELLPANKGEISQKTEDIVGPYALHDFFLYNMIRRGFTPEKILFTAKRAFKDEYDSATILKWLKTFIRRFFIQQFKRTCQPDGIKIGSVGLGSRGEWSMPADAVSKLWLDKLEKN